MTSNREVAGSTLGRSAAR